MKRLKTSILWLSGTTLIVASCMKLAPVGGRKGTDGAVVVREDPAEALAKAKAIREKTALKVADGLQVSLWASDSLAPDPVAMDIDAQGRVYLTRTNRQKNSEFDIRGYRHWMTPSIALQSVEDRRKFLRSTFDPAKSKQNEWLKDLNEDGSHDWRDLAVEKEEVWRIEDTNNDGVADRALRVLSDFYDEVSDIAGGILVRAEDTFLALAPDMWRLRDTNGDGVYDQKTSISHGYGVHIGFSGHNMSNPVEGPDGKIYWNMGDIGSNVTTPEGVNHKHPNEGVIARSNPDGSDFEVFASGLRNTHEFVFDEYGNLISSDNDGDHPGESERLVHVVEGSDAGWRSNWQYGKYTDPKNNSYKVWMDEKLYKPRWDGQAAYIIPPIQNFHNGPTGMVYNPGTALGSAWKNKFFLVEFVGNPARSPIWSFGLKPKGASFELDGEKDILTGLLPTGIRFGPDGALYVADWINGWDTKNYGRVWKLDVTEETNDLKAQRAETKRLMTLNYKSLSGDVLYNLLMNPDMRIRQRAQFELATRGAAGLALLNKAIGQRENQLARIHGIWGMGQLARQNKAMGYGLVDLLKDADLEIVAQAAKVLGDAGINDANDKLVPLLASNGPRVQFYAAQALGRNRYTAGVEPLLRMLKANNDADVYLRHAAVLALTRIGNEDAMAALAKNPDKSLRLAGALVLRRLKSEKIALFLKDSDEYIATEAARAINDDESIPGAMSSLAYALDNTSFKGEPLLRRAINANLRVGGADEFARIMAFAKRADVDKKLRVEALNTLASWAEPSVLDRVDGRYRGEMKRPTDLVRTMHGRVLMEFLNETDPAVQVAALQMVSSLGMTNTTEKLADLLEKGTTADVRVAALNSLNLLKYSDMNAAIKRGMSDSSDDVRTAALGLMRGQDLSAATLAEVSKTIFDKGSEKEQQQFLQVLTSMPADRTQAILSNLVDRLVAKSLSPGLALELGEAVDSTKSAPLIAKLAPFRSSGGGVADYQDALFGGNRQLGRRYFMTSSAGQCVRCHAIGGQGGEVGPSLTGIADVLTRDQILQALIEPSARLAPGYGSVMVTLKDGQSVNGILMRESAEEILLKTTDAEPLKIATSRIAKRENVPSSMPPMGYIMSKREIRDMVEFLANLKKG